MMVAVNPQPETRRSRRAAHGGLQAGLLAVLLAGFAVPAAEAGTIIAPDTRVRPPQEDFIYIPQTEWPAVIQQAAEGIFVTSKEYNDLYRRAREAYDQKMAESQVPDHLQAPRIVEASYAATIEEDVLAFSADFRIVQHHAEEQVLRLPLTGVRYQQARLNGEAAHVFEDHGHPALKIPGPGSHQLTVRFLIPITFKDKVGAGSFRVPRTPLNEVRVTAESYYDINFPGAQFTTTRKGGETTETIAFLGNADRISVEIQNRRSSSVKAVQLYSNEQHRLYLSEDLSEHIAEFIIDVRNDKITGAKVAIPKDMQVHAVTGKGIAGWSRREEGDHDVLALDFHIAVTGITRFTVELYRYRDRPQDDYTFGDVRLLNAADRQGQLSVYYDAAIRLDQRSQSHLRPLPANYAQTPAKPSQFLFRRYYVYNLPFALTLARVPVPRQTEAAQYNLLKLDKDRITFQSTLNLSGLKEGTSRYEFPLATEYRIKDLQVYVNNQSVTANHKHHKEEGVLSVDIWHPVTTVDYVTIRLDAERLIDQDKLTAAAQKLDVPHLTYAPAERSTGTLRIEIGDDMLLEDVDLEGYRLAENYLIAVPQREDVKTMTYQYRVPGPRALLTVSKRRAEQTSETVSYIAVDEDLLRANVYLQYQVTAGTQDTFYFAVPTWKSSKINIDGEQIKEKKKVALESLGDRAKAPAGVDLSGHDIWQVVLQKERDASYRLTVEYQKKIDRFDTFSPVPLVIPLGVSNDTGYLVLEASKNTEITSEKQGMSEVETYELPTWPAYVPSNRIIESLRYFTQPYTYRMAVKRMQELPVLAALVKKETLTYTFDTESHIFFEGEYAIRNTNQQYLQIDLPESFVLWGATVQGKGIKPRKGAERQLYVPLPVDSAGDIPLKITGQLPKAGGLGVFDRVKVSSPRLGMPVLESTVLIYFPQDYTLLNVKGNFEKLPRVRPRQPLLSQLFGGIFTTIWHNARRLLRLPGMYRIQGRLKSATDDIGDQFTAGNTNVARVASRMAAQAPQARYREADEVMLEEKVVDTRQYEPYYLTTEYAVAKDKEKSETAASASPVYGRKTGLLSLSIEMPREGAYVSAKKLWGNSRLALTFLAGGRERLLSAIVGLLIIALGFFVHSRKLMTPFMYCVAVLAAGTIIPLIVFQSYVFLFNGAVAGALLYALVLMAAGSLKRISGRLGLGVWLAALMLPLVLAGPGWTAPEPTPFPDVTVYVPYNESPPQTLTGSESLYIPTRDYFRLKMLAEPPYEPEIDLAQYGDYHLAAASIAGNLEEERLLMTARFDVFVNTAKDWVVVELPFKRAFIEKMTLDGKEVPVKVLSDFSQTVMNSSRKYVGVTAVADADVFQIPVYGKGYHKIEVVFHTEVLSQLGKKSVSFRYPGTHFTDLTVDFKRGDIFVELNNKGMAHYIDETGGTTVLRAAPAQGGAVDLSWFPRKYLKKSEKPLIYADCQVDMELAYDEARIRQDFDIRVEKSSIASMDFQVPTGTVVEDVLSSNVKSWQTVEESGRNVLRVMFKQEITDRAQITIKARFRTDPGSTVQTVFIAPVEAERVRGYLNIFAAEDIRLQLTDPRGLTPAAVQTGRGPEQTGLVIKKTYSFLNPDFGAGISKVPEERKITSHVNARHILTDDLLMSHYQVELNIKKNNTDGIAIDIPDGHKVEAVHAPMSSGYTVDGNRLSLPLIGGIKGKYVFGLTISKEVGDADRVAVASIAVRDIEKQTGAVSVFFPRGFEVTELVSEGLKSASVRPVVEPQDQAYRFEASYGYEVRETQYRAEYEIARKDPVIETVNVYHATVEDSFVDVSLLNLFTIKSSPVDHIDMIIPAQISDAIDISGDHINTVLKKPVNNGRQVAVRINLLTKADRSYLLEVRYKTYFDQKQTFVMPQVVFPQARNRTEFISVAANTGYQVEPAETEALIEVEADSIPALPQGVDINDILWSYRAAGGTPWNYRLDLQRLAREKLVKANIVRQDIKSLIIPSGFVLNEVVMRVNNRTRQFLPLQLPKEADLWSLKVAGESVKASRQPSDKTHDSYLVPLIKSGAGDRSFEIKLVYLMPIKKLGWSGRMDLGMLKTQDIPVEKTTLTVFVPENYQVGDFKTNTEEVDVSMIGADKTLEYAKEYQFWSSVASTSKGELRKKALKNREMAKRDFDTQVQAQYEAHYDLQQRVGDKKFNQKLVQSAQSKNARIVSEAEQIIQTNRAVPSEVSPKKKPAGKSYSQRRNVKGWNFKTGGYRAQDEVEQQVSNYLNVEDQKQRVVRQQQLRNMPQQAMAQNVNGQVAYGFGGAQVSQYDPNLQADLSMTAPDAQVPARQRASGGFQMSSYDTSLGLIDGLGGPAPQTEEFSRGAVAFGEVGAGQAGADGRYDSGRLVRRLEGEEMAVQSQVMAFDAPMEATQEFWGGRPQRAGELRDAVVRPPASAPAPQQFWGDDDAIDNLNKQIGGKVEAPRKPQEAAVKQSTLLKGYRSIDIPLLEEGRRFSFTKLGGNPDLKFSYRKRGVFARAGYLVLLIFGGLTVYGFRQMPSPFGGLAGRLRRIAWQDVFYRMADSNVLLIGCTIIFLPALFSGMPLAGVMLGLISISLLRRVTLWRYRKKDIWPPYTIKTFLHYTLSYAILICLALSFLVYWFIYLLILFTVLNGVYLLVCGLLTLFTRRVRHAAGTVEDLEGPFDPDGEAGDEQSPEDRDDGPDRDR